MTPALPDPGRRELLQSGVRGATLLLLSGLGTWLAPRTAAADTVWQIDPHKCIQCDLCATACVLLPSAVKCVHAFALCGYCERCTGFFEPEPSALLPGAENELCPTGAILRRFIEDPYYEYRIDEALCIGCARCVKGCTLFGNGAMHLQVRHDRCVNCNECAIARVCPAAAFVRLPADRPYLIKATPGAGVGESGGATGGTDGR
ncbi:MAG: ferredoxin [Planctomycetes bacterium]|nr:ferredoxin [Planctomycetota bacterium]